MPDIQQQIASRFADALTAAFGPDYAATDPIIKPAGNPQFGDFQANLAMSLAKSLKQKPRDVAAAIVDKLDTADMFAKVEIAGPGFINLHLDTQFLNSQTNAMAAANDLNLPVAAQPRTIIVDYACPNMAKEMHIGHVRSTCIGDTIARVLGSLGHNIIRQNHLGDWGTQFGMLLEHLIDTGWEKSGDHAIKDLDELYRESKKRFDEEAGFADRARKRVVDLQSGDEQALQYWQMLIDESVRHMNGLFAKLGVLLTDDDIRGESFYNPMLAETVGELEKLNLLKESDGARVVYPEGFKTAEDEPLGMIVQKSDGGFLYATTDLAAVRYRINELKADQVVYVTDARQSQHFAMVFTTVRAAGWADDKTMLNHVPFGTILGKDRKPFKTREGGTVKLADVIDEAIERALKVIEEKNPDLSDAEKQQIAAAVGIGAVKYADQSSDRIKDYVFDWDRMLAFDGNTSPYLQNAYVRIRSIFRKGDITPPQLADQSINITEDAERKLALKLLGFATVVQSVADTLEPHHLCGYLYDLASTYHSFYEHCPVLKADDEQTRNSRLLLSDLAARTLKQGLYLLGIHCVEQM